MTEEASMSRATRNLAFATLAFALSFTAWGLIAPLARKFEDDWNLSSTETAVLIAVPVILGSLLRIPVGTLTDRRGGRRMFAAILLFAALAFSRLAEDAPRRGAPGRYRDVVRSGWRLYRLALLMFCPACFLVAVQLWRSRALAAA